MLNKIMAWNERTKANARARRDEAGERLVRMRSTSVVPGSDLRDYVAANRGARIAELAGVHVFPDRIVMLAAGQVPDDRPIAGVEASVDASGGLSGRATLTRTAVPGAHGWQKKVDTRETWLVIDGPDFQWRVQIPQQVAGQARPFAAAITSAGRQAGQ